MAARLRNSYTFQACRISETLTCDTIGGHVSHATPASRDLKQLFCAVLIKAKECCFSHGLVWQTNVTQRGVRYGINPRASALSYSLSTNETAYLVDTKKETAFCVFEKQRVTDLEETKLSRPFEQ